MLGARVAVAENGRDGLGLLASVRPDAILCDLTMPVMDGLEFARALRGDARHRRTLLVAVTGRQDQAAFFHTLNAGFDAHLVKPVTVEMLASLARRLADRRADQQRSGA
jgi:CheY-like chemotaxis protein